jgi:hypothetical protein
VGNFSVEGCGNPVGYLAMGPQPSVGDMGGGGSTKKGPLAVGVEISSDEEALLELPPSMCTYEILSEHIFEVDIEECMAKYRMSILQNGYNESNDVDVELTSAEKDLFADLEAETRNPYDEVVRIYDVRKKNIRDIKQNPRITLPRALTGPEEAVIACVKQDMSEIYREYVAKNCDEKGRITKPNLSSKELRGLRSLLKRIQNREVMVIPSDKSGKLTVVSWDLYIQNMQKIIGDDKAVGWSEVGPTQARMNGHCSMWLKMTSMGSDWDQAQRIREALLRYGECVPPLYGLVKDHKPEGSFDPVFGPPYRPVCGASFGPNSALSDVLSEWIDVLADEMSGGCEVRATEELSYHFETANKQLGSKGGTGGRQELFIGPSGSTGGITIGSLDVVSMFTNLKAIPVSKMAAKAVLESSVEFAGVDYQMVGIYLALNYPRHELVKLGLSDFIPIRVVKPGGRSKITISSVECRAPKLAKEKWIFSPKSPSWSERKVMLSKAVEVGVRECFRNHLYTFNGQVYRQTEGGPIGLRLSMAISRLVMAMWDKMLMETGSNTGWLIHLLKRYVDDCTAVLETLRLGVRWSLEQGLSYSPIWEAEDKVCGLSDDQRTMREFQKMANTQLDFIRVTYDTCTDHESGKLPILDLQCWVEARIIYHMYYEKPMSSQYCIKEASAMSANTKWSSLSQEVIRRMKNTSQRVSHVTRESILTDYMRKLKRSGYPESFRCKILIKGLEGYTKMVQSEASGIGPINRPRGKRPQRQKRRLKKLRDKGEWYKRPQGIKDVPSPSPNDFDFQSGTVVTSKPNASKGSRKFLNKSCDKAKKRVELKIGSGSKWEYESVLYVPQTPGGELAAALRAYEKKRGSLRRIRIVERAGISLKNKLFSSNPWAKDGCSRDDCFPCKPGAGEGGVCRRENLTYVMTCGTCSVNGVRKVYWGETSRTLYQRGKEHLSAYLSESDKSALHKHSLLEHPQSPPDWKIKVHNYHQRPLRRQVEEGVLINNALEGELLNSKSEITRGGKIPRLVVMVGDKESKGTDSKSHELDLESIPLETVSGTVKRASVKTVTSKRQSQDGLKQVLIQPLMKKLRLADDTLKRKRLESKSEDLEEEEMGEMYLNEVHSVTFDKFGNGKVARLDSELCYQVDGWVEVGNQNIGNHASTVINQVFSQVGGEGGGGGGDGWVEVVNQNIGNHASTVINHGVGVGGGGGGGDGDSPGGCGYPSGLLALDNQPLSVGDISVEGCGDSVGYLAMGPQPSVGDVHLVGWCADPSGLLALDYQHPPVVGKCGLSEESRPGSRRQNKSEEENTRPGSRKQKKKKRILPMWMLQTSSKVMENGSSESCVNPDPVQPSAAHYTNKPNQNENIHSISKSKTVRKAQVTKQTNKQIKGQSKISRFLIPTKLSGVGGGVKAQTKTKTKNIHTIKPGSKQAHNQSDAQDIHTKHCEQGLYLAETS